MWTKTGNDAVLVEYDRETDVLYVTFVEVEDGGVRRTQQLDDRRLIDFDGDGETVGIEFLQASEGIRLDSLPRAAELESLLRDFPRVVPAA